MKIIAYAIDPNTIRFYHITITFTILVNIYQILNTTFTEKFDSI